MAQVWVARHLATGAVYALKMLMPHLAVNSAFRDMFFDEARIASRIRHANVCTTYDLIDLEGILTIVMEWVDGTSLLRLLRPGGESTAEQPTLALPLRHAVKIVAETSAGLHAAHELLGEDGRPLSVVHRDVSPHNVLLTRDGRVKVTDFGVAKALGKLHMTIAGQVKGKLAYMSPEQLVGAGVDRRSDVFALGTVLYETTTGQRPFQGMHDPQVMSAIVMGNFHPPSKVVPSYPPELEEIVLRAMASEAGARYANALQLKQALEGWLQATGPALGARQIALVVQERCGVELEARTEALSIPPPSAISRMPRSEQPARRGLSAKTGAGVGWLGGVLAILLGVALGLVVLSYVRASRRAHAAVPAPGATGAGMVAAGVPPPSPGSSRSAPAVMDAGEIDDVPLRSREVKLLMPENARIVVDGRLLPAGTITVTRPDAGVHNVTVWADGRENAALVVDSSSPAEIEVTMKPKRPRPANAPTVVSPPPNPYE
jgi:serine/threonine-protein kinase